MINPISTGVDRAIGTPLAADAHGMPESDADEAYLSALSRALAEASDAGAVQTLLDQIQGPASGGVMAQVDRVLNLGEGIGGLYSLSREELAESFAVLAELFERGIVGYEYREVNGEPQKVFIDVAIGSDLHRAPLYKNGRLDSYL